VTQILRNRVSRLVLIFVVLWPFFHQTLISAVQSESDSWTEKDRLAAAYFFYWHDVYTGNHIVWSDGGDQLQDHPPKSRMNNYSYAVVNWHRRELLDMIKARIDIVLPVFWWNDTERFWSYPGLNNLVTASDQLIAQGKKPPRIGMFCDTTALQYQNKNRPPSVSNKKGRQMFYDFIAEFFRIVPERLWAMIDSLDYPFKLAGSVYLQNTGLWKRHNFHLADANFDGRQHNGADFRISDSYWFDNQPDYFGRVWVSKSMPINNAPDLMDIEDVTIKSGQDMNITITAADPDGDYTNLIIHKAPSFVKLVTDGEGRNSLEVKPKDKDARSAPYRIVLLAKDTGNPPLADAAKFRIQVDKKKQK